MKSLFEGRPAREIFWPVLNSSHTSKLKLCFGLPAVLEPWLEMPARDESLGTPAIELLPLKGSKSSMAMKSFGLSGKARGKMLCTTMIGSDELKLKTSAVSCR